jgi:transcriptional antiterminator RfaH
LQTRPRSEKSLARRFWHRRIAFFLPLYKRQWRKGGRAFCSHMPLFPGYLFLHGDDETRRQAFETHLVASCLAVEDQPQLHDDLARVYRLMSASLPLAPEPRLQPGTPVRIIDGPLSGHEGKILRRGKQLKFIVEVRFLQRGVSVEIEDALIRPLVENGLVVSCEGVDG